MTLIHSETSTLNPSAADNLSSLGLVLLLRLAIVPETAKPPTIAALRKDLAKVLGEAPSVEAIAEARADLSNLGFVEPPPPQVEQTSDVPGRKRARSKPAADLMKLTSDGRSAAASLIGLSTLPAKITWSALVSNHLFAKAAGLDATKKLPTGKKLIAELIQSRQELPANGQDITLPQALDQLAFRELGFPDVSDWEELRSKVLSRLVSRISGTPVELDEKQIETQVPLVLLGVHRTTSDVLRPAVIRHWLDGRHKGHRKPTDGAARPAASLPALDLPAFAAAARQAAAASPSGWFGDNKVFIAHAWRQYQSEGSGPAVDLTTFKAKLIEAHRSKLIVLSRADLVAAMDPADVAESEAHYLNATFHFILIEGGSR